MEDQPAAVEDLMPGREVSTLKAVRPRTVYGWTYRKPPLPVQRVGRRVRNFGLEPVINFEARHVLPECSKPA
jgi:hypothetical protein